MLNFVENTCILLFHLDGSHKSPNGKSVDKKRKRKIVYLTPKIWVEFEICLSSVQKLFRDYIEVENRGGKKTTGPFFYREFRFLSFI